MNDKQKRALIALKKARTSTEGIIRMLEKGDYCVDIIQQNLAAMGLLKSAHQTLLENHLKTCFSSAMDSKDPEVKKDMVDEIIKISKFSSKFSCNWSLDSNCSSLKN